MTDDEMDDWMKMTDAQQEAELGRAMKEHDEWLRSLTEAQLRSYLVRMCLENCVRARRITKTFPFYREYLRRSQRRLVKLRYVGTDEGEA